MLRSFVFRATIESPPFQRLSPRNVFSGLLAWLLDRSRSRAEPIKRTKASLTGGIDFRRIPNDLSFFLSFFLSFCYSLRTEQPSGLDTGGVRFELSRALDLWARNSKLTFQEVNSDRADILVYFHR